MWEGGTTGELEKKKKKKLLYIQPSTVSCVQLIRCEYHPSTVSPFLLSRTFVSHTKISTTIQPTSSLLTGSPSMSSAYFFVDSISFLHFES